MGAPLGPLGKNVSNVVFVKKIFKYANCDIIYLSFRKKQLKKKENKKEK